jgi:hypothetical protein
MTNRPPAGPHDAALRTALEQQAALLAPTAAVLHAAAGRPLAAPTHWHGPASDAYAGLEAALRSALSRADDEVAGALRATRLALNGLGG